MADPVSLGPFVGIRDLSWGGEALILAFRHDPTATGAARSSALVFDRAGRYHRTIEGLADLIPTGSGEAMGLRATRSGDMAFFRQSTDHAFPYPDAQGAPFPWMEGARVLGARSGRWLARGVIADQGIWRLGSPEGGTETTRLTAPTVVEDPRGGTLLGAIEHGAGAAALGDHMVVGTRCVGLPDSLGRAPLALETVDDWASHRVVEAEAPSGDGPVDWRTSAVTAWGGRFGVVATRTTDRRTGHRLYAFAPGERAVLVMETGWVDHGALSPRPRGVMIRASGDAPGAFDRDGHGGVWPGDRLVLSALRCADQSAQGVTRAEGVDGLLVIDDAAPVFHPGPEGTTALSAFPLGEAGSTPLSWLCRIRDDGGSIGSALTADFRSWTRDPFPDNPPPPGGGVTHRWGPFAPGALS